MKREMFKSLFVIFLCFALVDNSFAGGPDYWQGNGRIAVSSDGNMHDNDDMLATMMTLMILAKGGLHDQTVLYTYCDHIWGSENDDIERMKASINGSNDYWNFWNTKFLCAVEDPDAAYEAMRDEIVKSTADDPLFIIAAGPMHVIGEGLRLANDIDANSLNHVSIISHSTWNENHGQSHKDPETTDHDGWSWAMIKGEFGSVNYVEIDDQNGSEPSPYDDNEDFSTDWSNWEWMNTHPDPSVNWVYTRGKSIIGGKGDYSDAGMAYYLVHNDEFGDYAAMNNWIGNDYIPVGTDDPTAVKGISLSPTTYNIAEIGGTVQLNATVTPETAVDKSITWESSNDAVATVSSTGLVTGLKAGSVTITVKTNDRGYTAKSTIDIGTIEGSNYCVGDDFIAFEAEATNSDLGSNWKVREPGFSDYILSTTGVDPINNTYLEYIGGTEDGNTSGNDILVYKFTPNTDGAYRLTGRMAQNLQGAAWDKCNDIYVKLAGDFTSANSTPIGTLTSWSKLYGRGHDGGSPLVGDWGAFVQLDVNHTKYKPVYNLKAGVEYTFSVSGRATRTCIDYYLFVKEQDGVTIAERADLATNSPERMRPTCNPYVPVCSTIMAHDFDVTSVSGYDEATKNTVPGTPSDGINTGDEIIGCAGTAGTTQEIAAEETYTGLDGDVYFTVKAVGEPDGECTYKVYLNGILVGEKQASRIFETGIAPYTYEDLLMNETKVAIKTGDVIRVTSNQVSNNLVPEGDGFATARGRWRSIEICDEEGDETDLINSVAIANAPTSVLSGMSFDVSISYTSASENELVAIVDGPTGTWLTNTKETVSAGSGTATLTIDQATAWAVENGYQLGIAIRPVGGDYTSNLDYQQTIFNVVEETNSVAIVDAPASVISGNSFDVSISYTSASENELVAIVDGPTGTWLTNTKETVSAGSGSATLTIDQATAWAVENGYQLGVAIRPVGGDFASNLEYQQTTFNVVAETIGTLASFQNQGGLSYMSSEDVNMLACNKNSVGTTEKFEIVDAGSGFVAFKGSNGKYVSSENGTKEMTCTRTEIGAWEKFTMVDYGNDIFALKGNNDLYVRNSMLCTSTGVSEWQQFKVTPELKSATNTNNLTESEILVYPNPADNLLNIKLSKIEQSASVFILDIQGKIIKSSIFSGLTAQLNISELSGIYLVKIKTQDKTHVERVIIK